MDQWTGRLKISKQWKISKLNIKKKIFFKDHLRDLWDNIKHTNFNIIGIPGREERNQGAENLSQERIAESFLNLGKEADIQV